MLRRLLRSRSSGDFRTRSPDRDRVSDFEKIGAVGKAIDNAIAALSEEKEGLERRIEDAVSRASVTVGNSYDEYLTRDGAKTRALTHFEAEMVNGRRRLKIIEQKLGDLKFMRVAFSTRFGDRPTE